MPPRAADASTRKKVSVARGGGYGIPPLPAPPTWLGGLGWLVAATLDGSSNPLWQFWNAHMATGDLAQALNSQSAALASVTKGKRTLLTGQNRTYTQIKADAVSCQPGQLTVGGLDYLTFADESTRTPSQLINGYTLSIAPSSIVSGLAMGTNDVTMAVQNATGFTVSPPFIVLIDSEQILVGSWSTPVGGTKGNVNWATLTRGYNNTTPNPHSLGATVTAIAALNTSIGTGDTSITLQGSGGFVPVVPSTIQIGNELIEITAGSNPYTVTRNVDGTSAAGASSGAVVKQVWYDPGIAAVTSYAHALSPTFKTSYSPLGTGSNGSLQSNILTNPGLATNTDLIIFEAQRIQEMSDFYNQVATVVGNIHTVAPGVKVVVQINAYSFANKTNTYTATRVINDIDNIGKVCTPDWITVEYIDAASIAVLETVMIHYRG